jgi:translation initiation factor 3 subunit F
VQRLLRLLDTVTAYVDDVVSGKRESDEALGRQIADALSAIPSLSMDRFRGSLDTTIKDTLMVTYLSQLATVHLKIAERISQLPAF